MNKSILVLDTPKSCYDCPVTECAADDMSITSRNADCPLKPVPEKPDYPPINSESYVAGYNACIDEILGKQEE